MKAQEGGVCCLCCACMQPNMRFGLAEVHRKRAALRRKLNLAASIACFHLQSSFWMLRFHVCSSSRGIASGSLAPMALHGS